MFEQTFKNIVDILWKEAGCQSELDYVEQTSWIIFLKYLDDLERERQTKAELVGKDYECIVADKYRWEIWAAPKTKEGKIDHQKGLTGDDLKDFVNNDLFPYLRKFKTDAETAKTIEYKIGEIFSGLTNKISSGYNLREIINLVDQLRFRIHAEKHEMSSLYEDKIKNMGNAGRNGGGRGGHIILKGNRNLWTLLHLRYHKNILAKDGDNGSDNNRTGRDGKDIVIDVPLGTIAINEETGNKEVEILTDGQEITWLPGGKGGLGNSNFATPTNQAPEHAQPGLPGVEGWKVLELKVLADVGLVGFPNAGKSTLLSVITAAKPKIADYAFTTITPNLGIVEYRDGKSFCIADLPGIIEGAAEGKGLGHRFLRHIERNAILLFLLPADSKNHKEEFDILVNELEQFNPELMQKRFIIAISKSDMLDEELINDIKKELPPHIPHIFISSLTNKNLTELKDLLWKVLNE